MKKVIKYNLVEGCKVVVGKSAIVFAFGHPNLNGRNMEVRTSEVLNYDEVTGKFETKNSIYELIGK